MTQKKLITLVTILICCMGLGACKGKDKPVEVKISVPESVELLVGDTEELAVAVYPKNVKPTFESSNTQVATISDKGVIKAIAVGTADIKTTAGNVSKVTKVSVIKPIDVDKSRYLGIDAPADQQKEFAPIYIPDSTNFTPNHIAHFKSALHPYGWIFKTYEEDPRCKVLYYFESPRKLDEKGKEIPEKPQFCMDALVYYHTPEDAKYPYIQLIPNRLYPKDYMATPETFDDPQDLEQQEALLSIMKHYGFTEDAKFTVLSGDNAYVAYNRKFDPKTPLRGVMFTVNKGGQYELYFQISYVRK
ncbi:Ig-like domain-containing protein [Porphyromonas uenonis]|uniref:Ig-like domain-containing protein n=1 Tax=Porphyromonas uenonis TaxID=281920 RepID=UPI0026EA2388|nr:Ig-like domain-containing protein [Porphyromonas uenonis]